MGFVKRAFSNFWSFLFILSGVADITLSVLCFSGVVSVRGFSLTVFLVCLAVGITYLAIGIIIAVFKGSKARE